MVQPIIVRDAGDGYEIVAGERRWRAAQRAEVTTIPAIVRPLDERESMIVALAENVAREDLNPVEQARAYAILIDELDLSQTEIARRVGKSRPAVANTMRLLELPDEVLDMIAGGKLSEGHGRALLLTGGDDERIALARRAVSRGLSVRRCGGGCQAQRPCAAGQAGDHQLGGRRAGAPRGRRGLAVAAAAGGGSLAVLAAGRSRSASLRQRNSAESSTNYAPNASPGQTDACKPSSRGVAAVGPCRALSLPCSWRASVFGVSPNRVHRRYTSASPGD